MALSDGFREFLVEQFAAIGGVEIQRMFGGAGLFKRGLMFGLVSNDVIYFKAASLDQDRFRAEGSTPFTYGTKHGPRTINGLWRCPERLLDDPDELRAWSQVAIAVAESAAMKKAKAQLPPKPKPAKAANMKSRRKPA